MTVPTAPPKDRHACDPEYIEHPAVVATMNGNAPSPRSLRRAAYLCLGYGGLVLGALGVLLPLLPATPFLLMSAWAFARCSPEMVDRLERHPRFGPLLRSWRAEGAIPLRAKVLALLALAASWLIIALSATTALVPAALGAVMGSVAIYILTRPQPTR